MTLKASFKETVSLFLTHLILVSFLPFFPLTVHALDVPSTGSSSVDWLIDAGVNTAKDAIETAVLQNLSSYDKTTVKILESELGFFYALGQDIWASEQNIENFTISGKSYSVLSGFCRIPVDGVNELCTVTMTFSDSGFCCRSKHGVYALVRAGDGLSPSVSIQSNYNQAVYRLMSNSSNYFSFYSGSFFDNPSPQQSPYFTNSSTTFQWSTSGDPPLVNQNSWNYTSSSVSVYCQNILRTDLSAPLPIDSSSDDVSVMMDQYKSALASQLGISVDQVDEVWTLPDAVSEEPTEPDGSDCCCEPFELPSEWVQSDVVELETDHYTVPYEDMIDEPFDYLAGLGTYPNPPTPALNARNRSETSTVTRAVSVEEGSPPLIWDMADYETKTALTDYFLFAENLLHDTGLYNLVGSLIAVGIIVSLV